MAQLNDKKRRIEESRDAKKPKKKIRKQKHYASSSSSSSEEEVDEFNAVNLADSASNLDSEEDDSDLEQDKSAERSRLSTSQSGTIQGDRDTGSDVSSNSSFESNDQIRQTNTKKSKRNDPTAFASSISTILGSKLTVSKRADPVLARSATAAEANASIADEKLEMKAKRKIREDKRQALDKGRIKDVILGTVMGAKNLDNDEELDGKSVGDLQEEERRLRKTAQRGVVKLFNAVRQAQVRAEEARKQGGLRGRKEERVAEMTKAGFLEMVASGGTTGKNLGDKVIEEA